MGRGAIVIGLAAVIIGEALFGKLFRNFALKLLAVAIGSVIYYAVIQAVVSLSGINSNYLKLLSALIVAVFLTVPLLEGQVLHQEARDRGKRAMLEIKEISKTFNAGHGQRKDRTERRFSDPERRRFRARSSAATARANPRCSTPWRASGR